MIPSARGRSVVALVGALAISAVCLSLVVATGSLTLGWILVPGGMVALENMRVDSSARLWLFGGAVANIVIWWTVLLLVLENVAKRLGQHDGSVA